MPSPFDYLIGGLPQKRTRRPKLQQQVTAAVPAALASIPEFAPVRSQRKKVVIQQEVPANLIGIRCNTCNKQIRPGHTGCRVTINNTDTWWCCSCVQPD